MKWNLLGQAGRQGISFIASIVLARLLTPREFGLLAMLFIFSEIANALVSSGLSAPLIQDRRTSQQDCSTVFYFNVATALLCYLVLVASAASISSFYREPELRGIVQYYGLVFLINSFCYVQIALLLRELNYRQLNVVQLIGIVLSSIVGVLMAASGFGVRSLVGQQITHALVTTALFWAYSQWRPALIFSVGSFRRLFGFGSKVLVVALLDKVFASIDNVIMGRLQGTAFLGQYSRGKTTRDLPITQITMVLTSVVFPLFSRIDTDDELETAHNRFIGVVSYICSPAMVGMGILAGPLITLVYSAKWAPAAHFLQLFCLFGITIPLNSILVQTLMATGLSGLFLRLELAKKAVMIVCMAAGVFLGPEAFVVSLCVGSYANLVISVLVIAPVIGTTARSIFHSMLPGITLAIAMGIPVYFTSRLPWNLDAWRVLVSTAVGVATHLFLSASFRCAGYVLTKRLLLEALQLNGLGAAGTAAPR